MARCIFKDNAATRSIHLLLATAAQIYFTMEHFPDGLQTEAADAYAHAHLLNIEAKLRELRKMITDALRKARPVLLRAAEIADALADGALSHLFEMEQAEADAPVLLALAELEVEK